MSAEPFPIFAFWEKVLLDILQRTQKFPKSVRFTFTSRVDNLALDIMEHLVQARWRHDKRQDLEAISVSIDKLRILLRLCHHQTYLDHRGYEYVSQNLDEVGRMVGGWLKQQGRR